MSLLSSSKESLSHFPFRQPDLVFNFGKTSSQWRTSKKNSPALDWIDWLSFESYLAEGRKLFLLSGFRVAGWQAHVWSISSKQNEMKLAISPHMFKKCWRAKGKIIFVAEEYKWSRSNSHLLRPFMGVAYWWQNGIKWRPLYSTNKKSEILNYERRWNFIYPGLLWNYSEGFAPQDYELLVRPVLELDSGLHCEFGSIWKISQLLAFKPIE